MEYQSAYVQNVFVHLAIQRRSLIFKKHIDLDDRITGA